MRLRVCENQVLILKELQRGDTVAYFRTDVNNPLTLLVNSKTHGKVVLHMTFESATGQVRFPVKPTRVALEIGRCRINQQSLLWPGLIITRAWRSPRQADQAP